MTALLFCARRPAGRLEGGESRRAVQRGLPSRPSLALVARRLGTSSRLGRLALAGMAVAWPLRASGESLADAIALAYASNPNLQAQRAQLRALDETYVQARAGWRPTVNAQVVGDYTKQPQSGPFGGVSQVESNAGQVAIGVTQPIFTGGRVAAEVRATQADVLAGREALRGEEASLLLQVVTSYVDVLRDQALVRVHTRDVEVLRKEAEDSRLRLHAGDITVTDSAQIATQLAESRTALTAALGQLQISRANYAAVVGQNPGELEPPPPMPGLPVDVDQAFEAAEQNNPGLRQAEITEEASRARVAEARAADRPTVSVNAQIGYTGALTPLVGPDYDRAVSATVTLNQPLFTGGLNASQIRRALELNTSDRIAIETSRRAAVQAVSQAWNQLLTQRSSEKTEEGEVNAALTYFSGARAEYTVGQRSTLDIVIAEQSLVSAESALAVAHHDAYVAEAAVLSAMGSLELRYLVPDAPLYDPARSFRRVSHKGAVPWEGLVAAVDNLGSPSPGAQRPIPAPRVDPQPRIAAASDGPPVLRPALSLQTAPFPNTTSPGTPETLGRNVASAEDPAPTDRTSQ